MGVMWGVSWARPVRWTWSRWFPTVTLAPPLPPPNLPRRWAPILQWWLPSRSIRPRLARVMEGRRPNLVGAGLGVEHLVAHLLQLHLLALQWVVLQEAAATFIPLRVWIRTKTSKWSLENNHKLENFCCWSIFVVVLKLRKLFSDLVSLWILVKVHCSRHFDSGKIS